jgi:hypothetical protein
MTVDALLGRSHLENGVDVEFLLLLHLAVDLDLPWPCAEILRQLSRFVFFSAELVVVVVVGYVFIRSDSLGGAEGALLNSIDFAPSERAGGR